MQDGLLCIDLCLSVISTWRYQGHNYVKGYQAKKLDFNSHMTVLQVRWLYLETGECPPAGVIVNQPPLHGNIHKHIKYLSFC